MYILLNLLVINRFPRLEMRSRFDENRKERRYPGLKVSLTLGSKQEEGGRLGRQAGGQAGRELGRQAENGRLSNGGRGGKATQTKIDPLARPVIIFFAN
jgi:hypothetical protein